MSGFQQVILLGHLGGDPEVKYTQAGAAVAGFSIATSRKFKRKDGEVEEVTSWHRVKAFGKTAEVLAQYAKKGDLLFVEGRLDYWKSETTDKSGVEVIVEHFSFAGGGSSDRSAPRGGGQRAPAPARSRGRPAPTPPAEDFVDDDIPY